jgi:ATP-dependent DNA ligase
MAFPIEPPVRPMLAKLQRELPAGERWLYEPKWDGFRAIAFRDAGSIHIGSRNTKPLERYFPDVVETLKDAMPSHSVIDGEIVIATDNGLDFDALQLRIHPASSRVKMLSEQMPSTFVAFDLLALDASDLRKTPFEERRKLLTSCFIESQHAFFTPQTDNTAVAADWFERFEGAGLDGIVAKPRDVKYLEGERAMIKVKHLRTADCVIGGYRMSNGGDGVGSLLLGLFEDGALHYVGHTSSFKAKEKVELLARFQPLTKTAGSSFGLGRSPGGPSRWSGAEDKEWIPVEPSVVCEVAFDHLQGPRFRHGTTFQRFRPDKGPEECTFEQFVLPAAFDLEDIRSLNR